MSSQRAEEPRDPPAFIKDLDIVERRIDDIDHPVAVHGQVLGPDEFSRPVPRASERKEEFSVAGELLHAAVQDIGDQHIPLVVHPDAQRPGELPFAAVGTHSTAHQPTC